MEYESAVMKSLSGKGESPMIRLRVPRALLNALVRAAKEDERTLSDFIRKLLRASVLPGGKRGVK